MIAVIAIKQVAARCLDLQAVPCRRTAQRTLANLVPLVVER